MSSSVGWNVKRSIFRAPYIFSTMLLENQYMPKFMTPAIRKARIIPLSPANAPPAAPPVNIKNRSSPTKPSWSGPASGTLSTSEDV